MVDPLTLAILFVFGIAIGSFLNVVILRYDGEHFLLDAKTIGGRSHCPHCKETLRWFELLPVVSYAAQGGRCRRCRARISAQYPVVELLSGFVFACVPLVALAGQGPGNVLAVALAAIWIAAFEALLVMSAIDIRLGIIPDEINIFLALLGVFLVVVTAAGLGSEESVAVSAFLGALFGAAVFAALVAVTRGKGMGMGDLKLAIPLGLLFAWPGIAIVFFFAFVIGAAVGVVTVALGRNSMKGTLPFGPFLALGAAVAFFWGPAILGWYLSLIGVR